MKPLKLKMNAFGPYPKCEEIDFTKLDSIYLVSGPTGAGKTSIFDAICFALYGETSGKSREQRDLKSDFASLDEVTYVDLEFSIAGDVYRIIREPQQVMKGRKTLRGHSVELHMPDNKIITRVADVKDKIEELLGLNVEQFRQIVMLPQGEFRKLIESTTEEKEKIFRRIFSSKIYKDFQDKLKDRAFDIKKVLEKSIESRRTLITKINPGENATLEELINCENHNIIEIISRVQELNKVDKETLKGLEKEVERLDTSLSNINSKIQRFEEKNNSIKELNILKEKAVEIEKNRLLYKDKEKAIEYGLKALDVQVKEKEYNLLSETYTLKENILKKTIEDHRLCSEELEKAQKLVLTIKGINSEIGSEVKNLHILEGKLKEYESYVAYKQEYLTLKKKLDLLVNKIGLLEDEINKITKSILDIDRLLDENKGIEGNVISLKEALNNLNKKISEVRDFYKTSSGYREDTIKHRDFSIKYTNLYSEYSKKKDYLENAIETFKRQQAGMLALGLNNGEPCPVCGSLEHPSKAVISKESHSEEEINTLTSNLEKDKEVIDRLLNDITALKARIDKCEEDSILPLSERYLDGYSFSANNIDEFLLLLKEKGVSLKDEIDLTGKKLDELEKIQLTLERKLIDKKALEKERDVKEESLKELERERLDLFGNVESSHKVVTTLEEKGIDQNTSLNDINNNITIKTKLIDDLTNKVNSILDMEKDATSKMAASTKNIENKEKELEEIGGSLGLREEEFKNSCKEFFKSIDEYRESLISKGDIEYLQGEVTRYKEEKIIIKTKIEELEKSLPDLNIEDLEGIRDDKKKIDVEKTLTNNRVKLVFSRLQSNKDILKTIKEITEELYEVENEYSIVSELSSMANGFNSKRITFERYVLLYHFNEILEAANIRFKVMTNDRFYLKHKSSVGDRRTSQGLDFDVYDNYTGKLRSIGSLSGGESFKASLALALGLSDVIQSYAGGVRIDTMFIDEGFGTLDSESLEKAIETLLELGANGRVVGIISHVQELKERIPSKIEVTRDRSGSYIESINNY
ncbi:MAG: SMC family ATPase [Clostridium sp.]